MQKSSAWILAAATITPLWAHRIPGQASEEVTTVIRVKNETTMGINVLPLAQAIAAKILSEANVKIRWQREAQMEPPVSMTAFDRNRNLNVVDIAFESHAPSDLRVGAMAVALPFAASGLRIRIFWDRVHLHYPEANGTVLGKIVGHVLAHEIGHVLLGSNYHSETGLMKAAWRGREFSEMTWRPLGFSQSEIQTIQDNLGVTRRH